KGVRLSYEEAELRGHPALAVTGEQTSPIARAQVFVMHCLRKPFPEVITGRVWHCGDENKIFYVGGLFDARNVSLVDEIIERTPCHAEEDRRRGGR
ncbi:MAG: hypothetical protein J7M38_07230, partial [Armatimonadetes bacterium]|nr:hypothetical protein [Armatimonadota bacterium]